MAFAVVAGYGIVICLATIALVGLSSVARLPVVARSSGRRMPQRAVRPVGRTSDD
jgi:hypothetical protein